MEHSIDREKVIKSLHCRGQDLMIDLPACDGCNYQIQLVNRMGCDYRQICRDALALLKEQEADKPKGHWMPYEPDKRGYTDGFICSRCERVILSDHYCKMIDFDFCLYCGAYMDNAEGR